MYDNQSFILFLVALGAYFIAGVFYFMHLAFRSNWQGLLATVIAYVGVTLHAGSIGLRWASTWSDRGWHIPLSNMYEYTSFFAFFLMTTYLVTQAVRKTKLYGGIACGMAFILMGLATIWYSASGPLVPALKSYWLDIHVFTMVVSSGVLGVGFVFAMLYLLKDHVLRLTEPKGAAKIGVGVTAIVISFMVTIIGWFVLTQPEQHPVNALSWMRAFGVISFVTGVCFLITGLAEWSATRRGRVAVSPMAGGAGSDKVAAGVIEQGFLARFPEPKILDHLSYRTIAFGFPLWTLGVMAGAIWAEQAWGRYWGFDPKETWSLITWFIYAGYLHSRVTVGWRGHRAALLATLGFIAVCFTFFAVNLWISGLHSYG